MTHNDKELLLQIAEACVAQGGTNAMEDYLEAVSTAPSEQEPDAELVHYKTVGGQDFWDIKVRNKSLPNGTKLYAAPIAQPVETVRRLKDHEIAALVNELLNTAVAFSGTQQLRQALAKVIVPVLKAAPAAHKESGK